MKYDPKKHHRRSIRLKGYDYSTPAVYYITVCPHLREYLFGEINNGESELNLFSEIVFNKWKDIPKHFRDTKLDKFIIMPNHIHGIIILTGVGAKHFNNRNTSKFNKANKNASPLQTPHGTKPGSLSAIMQNFLSIATRKINQIRNTPGEPVWQRNFYEHIIRNEKELNQIREYIVNNPSNWETDEENPENIEVKHFNSNKTFQSHINYRNSSQLQYLNIK
ncbi:transposase [candidate division KSB1 bacterium]